MNSVLLFKYIQWHFFCAPKELFIAWRNLLWFTSNYFSIGLLLRTYFAPWRRITWDYGKGFDIGRYLFILSSNFISRILGAFMRTFLIAAGILLEILLLFLALFTFIFWITLPILIIIAFFYGLTFLF
jgi:hypothetical protein